jgi:DNA polymerase-1
MTEEVGMDAFNRVHKAYPNIKDFQDETATFLRKHGYIEDWFSRKRWFPAIFSPVKNERDSALRAAINHRIQGPAASMLKIALKRLHSQFRERGMKARLLIPIHDEIFNEAPLGEIPTVALLSATNFPTSC